MELVRRAGGGGNGSACGSGDCPVLEVDVEHADAVFVIAHGNHDGISKLSGECVSTNVTQTSSGRFRYRYPESRFTASDWPTVYAIAVRGEVQQQVSRLMQNLPDACRPAGRGMTHAGSREQWLDRLDDVIAANRDDTVWTARRLP